MSTLLRVAYDGEGFHGFARQASGPSGPIRTVQGTLEAALTRLYRQPIAIRGASRTDAGVHAWGQLVAFEGPLPIPPQGVARALNGGLPPDVSVSAAWEEHGRDGGPVDVRRGNDGKHYRYRIRCTEARDPLVRGQWPLGRRLDPAAMQQAAATFVGTHDFAGFRSRGCQARTTLRTIDAVALRWGKGPLGPAGDGGRLDAHAQDGGTPGEGPDVVEIDVHGRAFLFNMVRIMVGTLVEVGLGRRVPASVVELLERPCRARAGTTAPACGLTLVEVRWPVAAALS